VNGGSGGPYITGWILTLFPYLKSNIENPYVWHSNWKDSLKNKGFSGVTTSSFGYHLNQVPFKWNYYNNFVDMLFVGGLIGVCVNKDISLQPIFGYAVVEDKVDRGKNLDKSY
jgi:hypothetical protein